MKYNLEKKKTNKRKIIFLSIILGLLIILSFKKCVKIKAVSTNETFDLTDYNGDYFTNGYNLLFEIELYNNNTLNEQNNIISFTNQSGHLTIYYIQTDVNKIMLYAYISNSHLSQYEINMTTGSKKFYIEVSKSQSDFDYYILVDANQHVDLIFSSGEGVLYSGNYSYKLTYFDNALNLDNVISNYNSYPLLKYNLLSRENYLYNSGYNTGHTLGEQVGYNDGYIEGFQNGENSGYIDGFNDGQQSGLVNTVRDTVYNVAEILYQYPQYFDIMYSYLPLEDREGMNANKSTTIINYNMLYQCQLSQLNILANLTYYDVITAQYIIPKANMDFENIFLVDVKNDHLIYFYNNKLWFLDEEVIDFSNMVLGNNSHLYFMFTISIDYDTQYAIWDKTCNFYYKVIEDGSIDLFENYIPGSNTMNGIAYGLTKQEFDITNYEFFTYLKQASVYENEKTNYTIYELNNGKFAMHPITTGPLLKGTKIASVESYGYNKGYNKGINSASTTTTWFSGIFSAISGFLSIQLFGSITFGTLILIPLVISLCWFIIKLWRGGGGS